jgi:proline iminopeptidase
VVVVVAPLAIREAREVALLIAQLVAPLIERVAASSKDMPYLPVSEGHTLYYEEHGNPAGRPVVVLHGGPGGGLQQSVLKFFDLGVWRVILFDQRGCGKSTPYLSLRANTTWHLIADIERLREAVGVDAWTVFGGSWGSTLALAYASRHPTAVTSLILRGIFLGEPWETAWLYKEGGASRLRPAEWKRFVAGCSRDSGNGHGSSRRLTACYRKRLADRRTRKTAARAWWRWEHVLSSVKPTVDRTPQKGVTALSVLENHYFSHNCWLRSGQLLKAARRIRAPVTIVQGELDLVCPPAAAYALHKAIPHSQLIMVPGAGHSAGEPGIAAALKEAVKACKKVDTG